MTQQLLKEPTRRSTGVAANDLETGVKRVSDIDENAPSVNPPERVVDPFGVSQPGPNRVPVSAMNDRRIVTILFCDVTGSTAMAGQLDPEDWAEVMGQTFDYLIRPVEQYGGTVARLMGDAILAFFGAPRAREDDPRRAVLAGLEILEGIKPFREEVNRLYGMDFNVRVGINTGLVILGEFGSEQAYEYTAMGDAINLAARMEQTAAPGTLQIATGTYKLVAPYFETVPLGEIPVKGRDEPEAIYQVTRPRHEPLRPKGVSGHATSMVGRDAEFGTLQQTLDNLEKGQGQIVYLVGEAGMGKSRLIEELKFEWNRRQSQEDAASSVWVENQINLYEALQPYGAFQQRIRKVLQVSADDQPETIRLKIAAMVDALPVKQPQRTASAMNLLLGVADQNDQMMANMEGEEFRREIYSLMLDALRNWNPGGPTIYVVDDWHWTDQQSAELLAHVVQLVDEIPILFLIALRPETENPVWEIAQQIKSQYAHRHTEITLAPLSKTASDLMLAEMLNDPSLTSEIQHLVTDRADGNPLFLEEILRSLVDQQVLKLSDDLSGRLTLGSDVVLAQASVPESLQALLLERIDRLSSEARQVLQQASVIGRTFSPRILEEITEDPDQLENILQDLCAAELVSEAGHGYETAYAFRHALVWETAYRTILRRQRSQYHRQVAEVLEKMYSGRLEEQAKTIGNHYRLARDERGIEWLMKAAERAHTFHAAGVVIEDTSQVFELASELSIPVPARMYLLRGQAFEATGDPEQAREDYHLALEYARLDHEAMVEWQAVVNLGMIWMQSDYSQTGAYFEQALDLARRIGDESIVARSMNRLGNWHTNIEQPDQAVQLHQQALAVFFRLGDQPGLADTYDQLGMANLIGGYHETAANALECAVRIWRTLNDQVGLATSLGTLTMTIGSFDSLGTAPASSSSSDWLSFGEEALNIANEIDWRPGQAMARFMLAYVLGRHGSFEAAAHHSREALSIAQEIGHLQWTIAAMSALGSVLYDLGQYEEANQYFSDALVDAHRIGSRYWQGAISASLAATQMRLGHYSFAEKTLRPILKENASLRAIGPRVCRYRRAELHLLQGEPADALAIAELLSISQEPGVSRNPDVSLLRGIALAALDRYDESLAEIQKAIQDYGYFGLLPDCLRAHLALASVLDELERSSEADQQRSEASEIAATLAENIADPDLRQQYIDGSTHRCHFLR